MHAFKPPEVHAEQRRISVLAVPEQAGAGI